MSGLPVPRAAVPFAWKVLAAALAALVLWPPHAFPQEDRSRAMTVARTAAQGSEGVLPEPPASVRVRDLGPDDVVLEVRVWADSRRSDLVATQSNVRAALIEAVQAAGIGLPDPDVRRVRIEPPHATAVARPEETAAE